MEAFTTHTGRAVPLRRSNIDTDQIIPSDYLKRVSRTGFADGLFRQWRADGGFVLDDPAYAGASVLLAGPDFGTGSSREHAVWALQEAGFRVVVSARFADIFRGNALNSGLLPVVLDAAEVETLLALVEGEPSTPLTVDLHALTLRAAGRDYSFPLEASARQRLLQGLDDIAVTLRLAGTILSYEGQRPAWLPRTVPG